MTTALHGWHAGEAAIQQKLGYGAAVAGSWRVTENFMREQHRIFHTSNLHFLPITTLDKDGRPWAGFAAGSNGNIGFVTSPDKNTLKLNMKLWESDPLVDTLETWLDPVQRCDAPPERFLIAGVGIEFSTRRRNKFAGRIKAVRKIAEMGYEVVLFVNEALGNCPKYINVRQFAPFPATGPIVASQSMHMQAQERLPDEVIKFFTSSDTVFVGSIYKSQINTAEEYPSHAGMNSRGGLPGFVRVKPSDGRTLVVPDYSGNRFLMSLGNIESTRLAGLTFVCFTTGDVLYITGKAQILVGPPAMEIMAKHASIMTIETTGFSYVKNALPVRQKPGTEPVRSPYSPKIKYLVDEPEALAASASAGLKAKLVSAVRYSEDIATFKFKVASEAAAKNLHIRPGQAMALDFMDWIGPPKYSHMADKAPGSINDDRVRTWTVSSAHERQTEGSGIAEFEMTMRKMPAGVVTGALFDQLGSFQGQVSQQVTISGDVVCEIAGVTGDFALPNGPARLLFAAGGIGLTPFLSMFSALAARGAEATGDVVLALAARDPAPFLTLLKSALPGIAVRVQIDLFTSEDGVDISGFEGRSNVTIRVHKGRIPSSYWGSVAGDRDVFICGPGGFGDAAMEGLKAAAIPNERIHREGFY
ncbi:hypothetical protein NLG97_g206 [Lecanicillium saksenae]|uniref:Uncharacterized protein n=1 Tax=Lecanicillium saksenae TaxID=468837 RepID=A0ACC1R901_9HYPO|nr:hypothetical protein NLG97_g206 [Lecanicillium saksenae]